eukprot:scaffold2844_cov326-Pavlova_lutheri.AAC.8
MVDEIVRLLGQSQERLLRCSVPRLLDHRFAALAKALDLFQEPWQTQARVRIQDSRNMRVPSDRLDTTPLVALRMTMRDPAWRLAANPFVYNIVCTIGT